MVLIATACLTVYAMEPQAPRAIVDAETGQLYGATLTGRWIAAEAVDPSALEGLSFTLYGEAGRRGVTTRLVRLPTEETCSNPTYRPSTAVASGKGTYLAAEWDVARRKAAALGRDNPTYQAELSGWLAMQGINDLSPTIQQLVRVDLNGDGRDEVILAAERQRGSITSTRAGDYAVLLLRRLQGEQVETVPLRADLYREDCIAECAPVRYRLFSTLDLDGDGVLELIVTSQDYESVSRAIHSFDDLKRIHLQWRCGP